MKQHLRFDSSVEYFAAGSEARKLLEEFQKDFGNDTYHVVLVQGDVFSLPFLNKLGDLHRELETADYRVPSMDDVVPVAVEAKHDGGPAKAKTQPDDGAAAADGWGDTPDGAWGEQPSAQAEGGKAKAASAPSEATPDGAKAGEAPAGEWGDAPSGAWGEEAPAGAWGDEAPADAWGEEPAGAWGEEPAGAWGEEPGAEPTKAVARTAPASIVEEVTSLLNARQTVFQGGAVRVRGLLDDMPTAGELPALRDAVMADPTLVGQVVGADGRHAVIMLRTTQYDFDSRTAVYRQLQELVKPFDAEGFRVRVTGMPALNAELVGTMQADMRRLIGGAFFIMAIVLGWLFRHPTAVIAPLIVVALAAIWTLGLMAATGTPVTLLTNIIPAFLACVGLGDSIHVQAVYRDARANGLDNHAAIVSAVGSTGMPILFTTLTTMVGLLSFQFATMDAIAEMGLFAAYGVAMALLHSVTFLPIALSFIRGSGFASATSDTGKRKEDWIDRLLGFATGLSARRGPFPVLVSGVLVVAIALIGVSRINVYHNPVTWLPSTYEPRLDLERMDGEVGGTAQVNLVVQADGELGIRDLELLRGLEKLEAHIREFKHPETGEPIVTGTSSILDIVRETNRALHGGDQDYYRLPDTQRGVSDRLLLFESASPRDLLRLATADLKKSHVTLRIHWMDATAYQPFTEHIAQGIDTHIGDLAVVKPTGSVYELVTTVGGLIGDLLRSFGAALVSVTLMMVFLLRSPALGLIAMIPNLVPVALIMGFMGFVDIPLDLTNLLIASIVIGVAVDNTVHYMFQWKVAYKAGQGTEGGIAHALDHAGRALVGTGLILAMGFGVYLLSSMSNIRYFGMLVGSACVFALFTNLVFAPALLRVIFSRDRVG